MDFVGRLGRTLAVVVNAPQQIAHAPEQYVIRNSDHYRASNKRHSPGTSLRVCVPRSAN